jgi:hypothetical protein
MLRLCVLLACASLLCACASTVKPAERGKKNLGSAAAAPFKDLGIIRPEAPKQLADILYPYDPARLENGCAQVVYEIESLDKLLGPESYAPPEKQGLGEQAGKAAGGAAVNAAEGVTTGFIPFRGVVREVSGASKAEQEVNRAIAMGNLRRAYLRGYGQAHKCQGILPIGAPPTAAPKPTPASAAGAPP